MTIVRTSLSMVESARRERFEPAANIAATNVQKAIEEAATDAAAALAAAIALLTGWRTISTATDTVLPTDRNLFVTANPCTLTFPLASTMTDAEVLVVDGGGGALANNIHNVCTGGELISGSADRKITTNYGFLRIKRNPSATGYALVG